MMKKKTGKGINTGTVDDHMVKNNFIYIGAPHLNQLVHQKKKIKKKISAPLTLTYNEQLLFSK